MSLYAMTIKENLNCTCICIDFDAIFVIFLHLDDLIPSTSVVHEETGAVDLSSDGNSSTDVESSVTEESCDDSSSSSSSEETHQRRKTKKSKKNKSKKHKKNKKKDKKEYDKIKRGKHSSHNVFTVVSLTETVHRQKCVNVAEGRASEALHDL